MVCKKETIEREQVIAKYLSRSLEPEAIEEFEAHYIGCDECFEELRVSELIAADLRASSLSWHQKDGVSLLKFKAQRSAHTFRYRTGRASKRSARTDG